MESVKSDIFDSLNYVSRGGQKLAKALDYFKVSPQDKVCIDCGASTGGFTDCLLKNGARYVYAIDVGYGQLAWTLRNDPRVKVMERTNIRYVTSEMLEIRPTLATLDVSFISLSLVLPIVKKLMLEERGEDGGGGGSDESGGGGENCENCGGDEDGENCEDGETHETCKNRENGEVICLIKPQFEAGKGKVGKKGVVREPKVHEEVLTAFMKHAADSGFVAQGIAYSPVKGPKGNIEYLAYLISKDDRENSRGHETETGRAIDIKAIVAQAHEELGDRS